MQKPSNKYAIDINIQSKSIKSQNTFFINKNKTQFTLKSSNNRTFLMIIKQAYQKRLKKQEQQISNLLNIKKHKPPKIGSIKNDKINYDRQEQYFSKDDIPNHARTVKDQIKNFIDPDHLGLRKRDWNASVSVPKNFQADQTHQQKLLKIKLGFMDHPLPKYKSPLIYEGTQTRNDYTNWNVSVDIARKQMKENLLKKTMTAFENTKLKETQYLKTYMDPMAKTTTLIENTKKKAQHQSQLMQLLREHYVFENPNTSQQKQNAAIFRLAYETSIKQKKDEIEAKAMKTDFHATLSQTQKSKIKLVSHHTGIWQKFIHKVAGQDQEYWAWSCCMNEEKKSSGCVKKIKDGNKWNLSSFNNF